MAFEEYWNQTHQKHDSEKPIKESIMSRFNVDLNQNNDAEKKC